MTVVCGDKGRWVVDGTPEAHFVFVKPTEANTSTNLNVITRAGNVYSLVLRESSGDPDMRVVLEAQDVGYIGAAADAPRYVPAAALDDFKAQAEIARERVKRAEDALVQQAADDAKRAEEDKAAALRKYPAQVRTDYAFKAKDPVFQVAAIYRDDHFTYIRATPSEVPAVYEKKDDKPALINFTFRDGLYILDHVVTDGYLSIGAKRLPFFERP
jgi:type IV secretory pathway VirB9-like protein